MSGMQDRLGSPQTQTTLGRLNSIGERMCNELDNLERRVNLITGEIPQTDIAQANKVPSSLSLPNVTESFDKLLQRLTALNDRLSPHV